MTRCGSSCKAETLRRPPEVLAGILGLGAELLLDAEQLVVLGQPLRPARGAGFDLAGAESNDEVGNEAILRLSRSVRHHGSPALREKVAHVVVLDEVKLHRELTVGLAEVVGGDGLGDGADLVHLEEQAVAGLLVDGGLDPLGVGDGEIVTDDLNVGGTGQLSPAWIN